MINMILINRGHLVYTDHGAFSPRREGLVGRGSAAVVANLRQHSPDRFPLSIGRPSAQKRSQHSLGQCWSTYLTS